MPANNGTFIIICCQDLKAKQGHEVLFWLTFVSVILLLVYDLAELQLVLRSLKMHRQHVLALFKSLLPSAGWPEQVWFSTFCHGFRAGLVIWSPKIRLCCI